MLNRTESRAEKKTRKKVTGVREMCSSSEDESVYSKNRIPLRGNEFGQAPPTISMKTSSTLEKKYKCLKEVETSYKETSKNSLQQLKVGQKREDSPKMNCCAKNLKTFLAPGEISLFEKRLRQSGDEPVYFDDDFSDTLKNFPQTISSKNSKCVSVNSSQAYSDAMLSDQRKFEENYPNNLTEKYIPKSDWTKSVSKSDIKCLKSQRDSNSRLRCNRRLSYGEEVATFIKLGDKTTEQETLSSAHSDESVKNLKLNELEKLDEEELRELYDYETSVNESRGSSNSSSNGSKYYGKMLNSKLDVKYNLKYKCKNYGFKSENERWQSNRDRGLVNSKLIGEKHLSGKKSFQEETSNGKIFDWKRQEAEAIDFDSLALKKPESGVMSWRYSEQEMAEPETKTFSKFGRKGMKSKITGCHYLNQKNTEHEMNLKHGHSEILETGMMDSKHPHRKRLESEVINFTDENQKLSEPAVNLKYGDWNCLEPEMIRSKNLNQKLPVSKTASCKPMVLNDSLPLDNKSSVHFCHMLAKSLPNGKIISFDKLSEILPEAELTKLNEKINENIKEKQLLPSLFEDTQSHIDRIKEQILLKAKDCLPKATFSKINQFLSSNKSESEPETVRSMPFLIPETKTCPQIIASSGQQRSTVSCHEGDGMGATSTCHTRDVPMKCGRKLSSSSSYYDHLYSVYGSKHCGSRSRKYGNENTLVTQTSSKNRKILQKIPESSKSNRKGNLSCGASNEDFLKVRYSNKYKCTCIFDSDNFKTPISGCESKNGLIERSIHDWSVDSDETDLIFIEYDNEYLPLDYGVNSDCVSGLVSENFTGFKTLNFQTVQQQDDADTNFCPLKPFLNSDLAVTVYSCPLNSLEGSLKQPDLSPDIQQNNSKNSGFYNELVLQQTLPEGGDLSLDEPYNQSFETSTNICSCTVVYQAGDCMFEMSRCGCKNFDPVLKNLTLVNSPKINFDKRLSESSATNTHFYDANNLIHESDHLNSWKHIQGPGCFENESFEPCNGKVDLFESYQHCPYLSSSYSCSSVQKEDDDCKRKYETFNFNDFGDSCVESTHCKYHSSKSRRNQSLVDFDSSEFWHGLYEPTDADESLNSQYYLYLMSKLLGSEIFKSGIEKLLTKNFDFNHSDANIRSSKMVPEVPKSEFLNYPKIEKECNQLYSIHFLANRVKERSNLYLSWPKSKHNSSVPSVDFGNCISKKFRTSHLYSNWNFGKRGFGFGFKEKFLISKTHKKHTCKFRNWLNYAACRFLKSGVNLKLGLNKSVVSQFKRSAQERRIKLRVKSSNHSNILVPVPGITPVSTPRASHVLNPSNSIGKISCHQTEISPGFAIESAHKILFETLSNVNIWLPPQPMQSINWFISLSQNSNCNSDCDETKTCVKLCKHQYFEYFLPAPQNCDITLEYEQTSNFEVRAFLESRLLQKFETSETHASSRSFYKSNLKRFPNSVLNSCSEPNTPQVPDGYKSNLFMEHFLEAVNFIKMWNSFQLSILFTPSYVLIYPETPSIQDLELESSYLMRCHHKKSAKISICKLRNILEPNVDLQNFKFNSKVRVFQGGRLECAPKSGHQARNDNICQDISPLYFSSQVLEPHSQCFIQLKQGWNAFLIKIFSPKNELPFFHSASSLSKTILASNYFNFPAKHNSKINITKKLQFTSIEKFVSYCVINSQQSHTVKSGTRNNDTFFFNKFSTSFQFEPLQFAVVSVDNQCSQLHPLSPDLKLLSDSSYSILDSFYSKNYDSFKSYDSSTCQKPLIHQSDMSQSEITGKSDRLSSIPNNSHTNRSLQSLPPVLESMTDYFLPKNVYTLEPAYSSYFHLLSLLDEWHFKLFTQKEIRNPIFFKTWNNRKVVRFVDSTTQTDLCLTNSEHFDSFLLAHILSLDESAEHVTQ